MSEGIIMLEPEQFQVTMTRQRTPFLNVECDQPIDTARIVECRDGRPTGNWTCFRIDRVLDLNKYGLAWPPIASSHIREGWTHQYDARGEI